MPISAKLFHEEVQKATQQGFDQGLHQGHARGYKEGYEKARLDLDAKRVKLELLKSMTAALSANAQALEAVSHGIDNLNGIS